jgi:type II secretory pathway component PulJ
MRSERGETNLVGLLVAMALSLVVFGATLDMFVGSQRLNNTAQMRNDAQDRARVAVDGLARQLRNLASPNNLKSATATGQPTSIDVSAADQLIFKIVNPVGPNTGANVANVERLRYCLNRTTRSLWRQEQTWTATVEAPATPTSTACPGTGWDAGKDVIVAGDVTNYSDGLNRPIFTYNATTTTQITSVHIDLYVDLDVVRRPREVVLSTGVDLRNQNGYPAARFTSAFSADRKSLVLNGSTSTDAEGSPLEYCWYDSSKPNVASPPPPCRPGPYVGRGITVEVPSAPGTTHNVWLEVWDSGLLPDREPDTGSVAIANP